MTRKDYEKIASVFNAYKVNPTVENQFECGFATAIHNLAESTAYMLSQDNPRFNRARFLKACGIEQ